MRGLIWLAIATLGLATNGAARDLSFARSARENWPGVSWNLRREALRSPPHAMITAIGIAQEATLDESALEALGGRVVAGSRGLVRLRIPAGRLREIARQVAGLDRLRLPYTPMDVAESEGVDLTAARLYHESGTRGEGVRVAIVDLGFAGLDEAIEHGEIPSRIERINFSSTEFQATTYHGTAVTEIVHDMAPGSDLVAIKVDDEVSLAKASDYCVEHGVDVINHSVAWFNTNFYDGTGYVCDVARDAVRHGIIWVNAAGNSAQRHWEGAFVDGDGDGLCEFRPGDEGIEIAAFYGSVVRIALTWDDWVGRHSDFDLFLLDDADRVVASSRDYQGSGREPTEFISYEVESTGRYSIAVSHEGGPSAPQLELYLFNHDIESDLQVKSSSMVAPADAAEVIAVGAVRAASYDTGPQEPYSSRGPSNAGLAKPDIVGPDAVSNYTYGLFAGTSAASPHVAGAVALLRARDSRRSPESVRRGLFELAWYLGENNVYGHGAAFLDDESPPWPPPAFSRPPGALSPSRIDMQAAARKDPSGVQYAIVGLDGAPGRGWEKARGFTASGLESNTPYRFRVKVRDRSPRLNEAGASEAVEAWTQIEVPGAVVSRALSPTSLVARIAGHFTGLQRGDSALLLQVEGPGAPDPEWGRMRDRLVDGLQPNTRYTLFARARNAEGVMTSNAGPFARVTPAAIPPAPKLVAVRGTTLELSLDPGANPADTELALYNATRATFVRPSGLEALEPVFAPPGLWRRVSLSGLAPATTFQLYGLARNREGRITHLSSPLSATTQAASPETRGAAAAEAPITDRAASPGSDPTGGSEAVRRLAAQTPDVLSLSLESVGATHVELHVEWNRGAAASSWLDRGLECVLERHGEGSGRRIVAEGVRVVDRGLSPDRSYSYQARLQAGGVVVARSGSLQVVTEAVQPEPVGAAADGSGKVRAWLTIHDGWDMARWRLIHGANVVWESGWRSERSVDIEGLDSLGGAEPVGSALVQVQVRNRAGRPAGWSRPLAVRREVPEAGPLDGIEPARQPGTDAVQSSGPAPPQRGRVMNAPGEFSGEAPLTSQEPAASATRDGNGGRPVPALSDGRADGASKPRSGPVRPRTWAHATPFGPRAVSPTAVEFFVGPIASGAATLVECTDGVSSRFLTMAGERILFDGLQPNRSYSFRFAGSVASIGPADSWRSYTEIEAPEGLELVRCDDHAVVLAVNGRLSHLDSGLSGIIIEELGGSLSVGARGWTRQRRIRIGGLRPDTTYRFCARARNGEGRPTDRSRVLVVRTLPAAPPRPGIEAVEASAVALRLEAGANPPGTELCLEDVSRGLFLSPRGRLSARPVYAPATRWQHVVISGLEPGRRLVVRTRARGGDGRLGPMSGTEEATTPAPGGIAPGGLVAPSRH